MESWEYLIQKEGDRAWLPLETATAELEAGCYRVVARASRPHTEVEVRLMYESVGDVPPQKRVHKRIRHTNKDGLMVVFPYTELKSGIWEISCAGDLMSDLLGNGWKYTVKLQVLPSYSEVGWEGEDEEATSDASAVHSVETVIEENSLVSGSSASKVGDGAIASKNKSIDESSADPSFESRSEPINSSTSETWDTAVLENNKSIDESLANTSLELDSQLTANSSPLFSLTLDKKVYAAREDRSVTISGEVALAEIDSQQLDSQAIEAQVKVYELAIDLREPQNSKRLLEVRRSLSVQVLPRSFAYSFKLPSDCETRLILGEVKLFETGEEENKATALATADLTITVGINELIEKITQQHYYQESANPWEKIAPFPGTGMFTETDGKLESTVEFDSETKEPRPAVNLVFLHLAKQPKERHRLSFEPAINEPLPPQIYQPKEDPLHSKSPQLPLFGAKREELLDEEERNADLTEVSTGQSLLAQADSSQQRKVISLPPIKLEKTAVDRDLTGNQGQNDSSKVSPLDRGFRLKLQKRFSERLQDLAKESEESELSETETETKVFTERLELEEPTPQAEKNEEIGAIIPEVEELISGEFEVHKEEELSPWERGHLLRQFDDSSEQIPQPQLEVPEGDLVAEEAISIRIKLPSFESKLFVKLWVVDLQTRSLLGGPHWLVDFEPHISGGVETKAQLIVPPGCMEIQIEAIAVEIKSQRESRKVTINRMVVPPNLPDSSLEEFDMS